MHRGALCRQQYMLINLVQSRGSRLILILACFALLLADALESHENHTVAHVACGRRGGSCSCGTIGTGGGGGCCGRGAFLAYIQQSR